jgi:co-chaperonin GroES (HSP10)
VSVSASATLRQIAEESGSDPRGAILRIIGDYTHLRVAAQQVLVAGYIRPEKTKGGIIRTDRAFGEDRFQGKVGLVLTVGSLAFVDDSVNKFGGFSLKPGDWAIFRPSDGLEMFHVADNGRDGVPIRWFADTSIVGSTLDPERIY